MKLSNDMEIEIYSNWYNKTIMQPDGVTQIVDTSQRHTVYQVGMAKNYFLEDKNRVVDELIHDLKDVTQHLEQLRAQEKNQKEPEL